MKKFWLLVYLTQGYESMRNKIDHLCLLQDFFLQMERCSEIILATAKNKFRIIWKEVTICPICCGYIFRLSLSFNDFISSISEWLSAVPKFLIWLLLSRFQSFCISSEFASISYHLITGLKPHGYFTHYRSDKIDLLRVRSPISYCKTKYIAHVFVFVKGIHFQCWFDIKLKLYLR